MGRCNCESLVCKMPHADGSRVIMAAGSVNDPKTHMAAAKAWTSCKNDALDDFRVMYIGPVCRGCFESTPKEYRMARNPQRLQPDDLRVRQALERLFGQSAFMSTDLARELNVTNSEARWIAGVLVRRGYLAMKDGIYSPTELAWAWIHGATRNPNRPEWSDDAHQANDLYLYIENTGELYAFKQQLQADPRVYDARLAPYVWIDWVNIGAAMYVHEMILGRPLSTFERRPPNPITVNRYFPERIRKAVAIQVADHERRRLIHERDYAPPVRVPGTSTKNPRRVR
jgi:hypothetical protein